MAWTDVMPVLTDELVDEALAQFNAEDEALYQEEFGVSYVTGRVGARPGPLLSTSLFWRGNSEFGSGRVVTRQDLEAVVPSRGGDRFNPWHHYVEPLLQNGPLLVKADPAITIRVYLSRNLEFLVPDLAEFAEVCVMRGESRDSAPGMLWRFLALENQGDELTILDADLIRTGLLKLEVTRKLPQLGLGAWRIPVPFDGGYQDFLMYRPFAGGSWGAVVPQPMSDLFRAFRWCQRHDRLQKFVVHPRTKLSAPVFGAEWPAFGSDEYFLTLALYPRLAQSGLLTLLYEPPASFFLPLDIEYATWSNSQSMIDYSLVLDLCHTPIRDENGREVPLLREEVPRARLEINEASPS